MKKKNFVSMLMLGSVILGTSSPVMAMEYDSPTEGRSKATIDLSVEDPTIPNPDPDDPEIDGPDEPGKPNPFPGELKIQYLSDFKFGNWEYTGHELVLNAAKDTNFTDKTTGETVELSPFVAVQDVRTEDQGKAGSWTLKAEIKKDFTATEGTSKLTGAKLVLGIENYEKQLENNPTSQFTKNVELNPGEAAKTIVVADNMKGQKSVGFDPAQLVVPAKVNDGQVMDDGEYSTEVFWTLEAGI